MASKMKYQTSDHAQDGKVSGTKLSTLTPRQYQGYRHSSGNGVDGQTANETGNRNKRS